MRVEQAFPDHFHGFTYYNRKAVDKYRYFPVYYYRFQTNCLLAYGNPTEENREKEEGLQRFG